MAKRKEYRISIFQNSYGMYEADDFRLKGKGSIGGKFTRDKSVKGSVNGHEIGIFTADDNTSYLIFKDHSARYLSKQVGRK